MDTAKFSSKFGKLSHPPHHHYHLRLFPQESNVQLPPPPKPNKSWPDHILIFHANADLLFDASTSQDSLAHLKAKFPYPLPHIPSPSYL